MAGIAGACYPPRVLTRLLFAVRERFHPLHRLRRNRLCAAVLARLDRPVSRRVHGLAWPIRVRAIRHLSLLLDSRIVEPGVRALFIALARERAPVVFWNVGANVGLYSLLVLSHDPAA